MKTSEFYKSQLLQAEALLAERRFDEAHAILDPLAADADTLMKVLGSATSLGLPRRLQSSLLKLAKRESDPIRRVAYQYHLVPPPEVVSRNLVYAPDAREMMVHRSREPVPRTIHQIWIGTKPVPVTVEAWQAHAAKHGYHHRLWREADLESLGIQNNEAFREMLAAGDYPGAVDVARYVILEKEGGIYLDCDWFPARDAVSFHHLLPMIGLHAFAEPIPRNTATGSLLLANSFIAAPPRHPVFEAMLAALPRLRTDLPSAPAWWVTGPLLFTVAARAAALSLAPANFVAAHAASGATLDEVKGLAADAEKNGTGLLIVWKPW